VDLKKQVKAANDIADVVEGYVQVQKAGKQLKALCPFHNDTRPSLVIDRQWQNFRCWSCDARGDVFDFVMKYEKVAFPEALRILADRRDQARPGRRGSASPGACPAARRDAVGRVALRRLPAR